MLDEDEEEFEDEEEEEEPEFVPDIDVSEKPIKLHSSGKKLEEPEGESDELSDVDDNSQEDTDNTTTVNTIEIGGVKVSSKCNNYNLEEVIGMNVATIEKILNLNKKSNDGKGFV